MHKRAYYYAKVSEETPQHGDVCSGCFRCLHCTSDRKVWAKDHQHSSWKKRIRKKVIVLKARVKEWLIVTETYTDAGSKLACINFHIYPLYKKTDENEIDSEIIARCKTYEEALELFEKHLNRERRKLKALALK